MAQLFASGTSGRSYSTMAWINCNNVGNSWYNIWHLSPNNANTTRNPALWLNVGSRYIHACFTNSAGSNGNVVLNSGSGIINFYEWYHVT
jgi:hypothetical protein